MLLVMEKVTQRFNDRIGMFGSSLGGMITFYLLPDLEGVHSAPCRNWFYPGDTIDPSRSWLHNFSRFVNLFAPQLSVLMNIILMRVNGGLYPDLAKKDTTPNKSHRR